MAFYKAGAIQTPVNLPTSGHFSAISRVFREAGFAECLAMAKADHRDAYKQLPVRGGRKMLAVAILRGPKSGEMGGFGPHTQLFGATAAVSRYSAVSKVMATLAVRWL